VHGGEKLIRNPFGRKMPRGNSDVKCQGLEVDSAGKVTGKLYDLEVESMKWRAVQTRPGQPQRIGVTVKFDQSATGQIGERIAVTRAVGSRVALTTATQTNVDTITLTPGTWDITLNTQFGEAPGGVVTFIENSISTVSATISGIEGDQKLSNVLSAVANYAQVLTLPSFRLVTTATSTTVYHVVRATFSAGTIAAWGRLSAIRAAKYNTALTGRVTLRFDGAK
jgi:hypothetical protein